MPTARISMIVPALPLNRDGGSGSARPNSAGMTTLTTPSTAGRISIRPMKPLSDAMTEEYLRISVHSCAIQPCGFGGRICCGGGMLTGWAATASMSAAYIW